MTNHTFEINKIIADADIKKWQLAQELGIAPSYVTIQLRDGIKSEQGITRYYDALKRLLNEKQREITKAKQAIQVAESKIGGVEND